MIRETFDLLRRIAGTATVQSSRPTSDLIADRLVQACTQPTLIAAVERLMAHPDGRMVGVAAWIALRYKWERMSSWIVSGEGFRRLDRRGVRDAVLGDPPRAPWAAYATTSYKKHGALLAPVNGPGRAVWQWDEERIDCSDIGAVREVWDRLRAAQDIGLSRLVLESLDCPAWLAGRVGLREWLSFERWARPRYRSALYRFLCYLLPSQEELKGL